ncbi:MAG TPA: glycosyltransferase family 39 protein [Aggregatilineaceae bacterium]|nr:glycosyltransferase family 39 protein [Aggregatilineaceae bacterium]
MNYTAVYAETRGRHAVFPQRPGVKTALVVWLLTLLVSFQYAPSVIDQRRDSGTFAYTGKVILDGGLPYVDAWDNKLPGVYYLDALAFALFGVNRWALWLTETTFVYLATLLMFWLILQAYRRRVLAWIGALLVLALARHPGLVSDVNFTEPYALLPQMMVWIAGYQFLRVPRPWSAFLIGFAAGAAMLFKQTTIGVALAFIPAMVVTAHPVVRQARRWLWLAVIALGGLTSLGSMAVYLALRGILMDAIEASFVAASEYHDWVSHGSVWIGHTLGTTLTASMFPLVFGPFLPFLVTGGVALARFARQHDHMSRQTRSDATLAAWSLLTFGCDLVLANITNRGYAHYYISLIPASVLLIVAGVPVIAEYTRRATGRRRTGALALWLYFVLVTSVPLWASLVRFRSAGWDVFRPERYDELATYVAHHTTPHDTVLVWGVDVVINFQSGRDSPTEYDYGYPLVVPNEETQDRIQAVIRDLEVRKPVMIVDTTFRDGTVVPPLNSALRIVWWVFGGRRDVADLEPIYQFVGDHCDMADQLKGAVIYRCKY